MKAELTLPPEMTAQIAQEVAEILKPLLIGRKPDADTILDVDGLAGYLGIKKARVYEMVSQSTVPHFKIGKFPRFRKSAIDEWIKRQSVPPVSGPPRAIAIVGKN